MKLLTKGQQESNENEEICFFCKEKFEIKYRKDKKYPKVRYYCHYTGKYRGAVHSKWNLLKNPIFFYNVSKYDYHFITKELVEEFKKQFTCLG